MTGQSNTQLDTYTQKLYDLCLRQKAVIEKQNKQIDRLKEEVEDMKLMMAVMEKEDEQV